MLPKTYLNNTSNLLPSQDFGIKISSPFYDVNTARDVELVFSSAWPSLQVVISDFSSRLDYPAIEHGLGFPPFAIFWDTISPSTYFRPMVADSKYIYHHPISATGMVVIYNLDISHDVEYPFTQKTSLPLPYDNNFGIKFAKEGKSLDSTDLRDFVLHSRCQSMMVLAVKTEATYNSDNQPLQGFDGGVVQHTQSLGYPTVNFGYVRGSYPTYTSANEVYVPAPMYSQSYPRLFSNGTTSYVEWFGPDDTGASLVVLRNPFFAATTAEVTY